MSQLEHLSEDKVVCGSPPITAITQRRQRDSRQSYIVLMIAVFTQFEFPAAEGNGVLSPAGFAETKGIPLSVYAN